eukprot:gene2225-2936_t
MANMPQTVLARAAERAGDMEHGRDAALIKRPRTALAASTRESQGDVDHAAEEVDADLGEMSVRLESLLSQLSRVETHTAAGEELAADAKAFISEQELTLAFNEKK